MINKLFNKLKDEKGLSNTIIFLFFIFFFFILSTLIVDLSKLSYLRNDFYTYTQQAVQASIKEQDNIGNLSYISAEKAVDEYMIRRDPNYNRNKLDAGGGQDIGAISHTYGCNKNKEYPKITLSYSRGRTYDLTTDPNITTKTYPESVGGNLVNITDKSSFYQNEFNVIQMNVTEVVDNTYGAIIGRPCTEIHVSASAITATHFDNEEK